MTIIVKVTKCHISGLLRVIKSIHCYQVAESDISIKFRTQTFGLMQMGFWMPMTQNSKGLHDLMPTI